MPICNWLAIPIYSVLGNTGSSGAGKPRRNVPSGAKGVDELFTPRYGFAGTTTRPFNFVAFAASPLLFLSCGVSGCEASDWATIADGAIASLEEIAGWVIIAG